jgi:hypothetical protein
MREIRTSGSVRGEEGNLLAYSTPGPGPRPSSTSAREGRVRKFPNAVKEETYDSHHWGRWVWTGYVYVNKDSNPVDAGRRLWWPGSGRR